MKTEYFLNSYFGDITILLLVKERKIYDILVYHDIGSGLRVTSNWWVVGVEGSALISTKRSPSPGHSSASRTLSTEPLVSKKKK